MTSSPTVVYFGGNGHATARLEGVRRTLDTATPAPFNLVEAHYPGFERRPRAKDLQTFLTRIGDDLGVRLAGRPFVVHGTGIGGLLIICLRAHGYLLDQPVSLHAPVLWGLERRWMPRLLRLAPFRGIAPALFQASWYQRRFVRRQFQVPPAHGTVKAFFQGYADCAAFGDLFEWLTPALLRDLEVRFAENDRTLQNIELWWGGHDQVVAEQEYRLTQKALSIDWPLTTHDGWGHYPMIDDPDDWVRVMADWTARVSDAHRKGAS